MKIPEPKKLPSGNYLIQVQVDGKRVSKTFETAEDAILWASSVKVKKVQVKKEKGSQTLSEAIDAYIEKREGVLSKLTIRGYRIIQENRFKSVMDKKLNTIDPSEWQSVINKESKLCAAKTLKNAYGFLRSVVKESTGEEMPDCKLPQIVKADRAFLKPEQIKPFIEAVAPTRYAIPLLLALSSLRISEISALRWEDIDKDPEFIKVRGAMVLTEDNTWVRQKTNKNQASNRNVPIMIPQLKEAIERDRKDSGFVMDITQNSLRSALKDICEENNLPPLTVHGLRHSFASLAYHLQVPEQITMEIGGWSDQNTMHKIYTHIAQSDITHYSTAMADFFAQEK